MHGSVTVHMQASPEHIWGLISDITNTGKFSPETFEAEWLDGADGPAVGARFRGHVKRNGRGPIYWTNCRITDCEPGKAFAFEVLGPGDRAVNTWRYDLERSGDGTAVTESFSLQPSLPLKLYWSLAGRARGRTNQRGMQATLERIKAEAESTASTN